MKLGLPHLFFYISESTYGQMKQVSVSSSWIHSIGLWIDTEYLSTHVKGKKKKREKKGKELSRLGE